ncbi:probable disease resistance RPP8-like protein 4 [Vitis riparia]|uniref:probable disease resistance RPP8-like protein 4 n=1 Tax=Vitis riparia TaxID=96939 RepID=UPI00155A1B36|nr:probable disease resistance RPP8-like protein 4 [Vitis riparia]
MSRGRSKGIKGWKMAEEVRKLVYDAEDIIDEFLIRMENPRWNFIKPSDQASSRSQIQKVKKRVDDIVGIEVHVEQLVELLIEGKSDRRQVISVFAYMLKQEMFGAAFEAGDKEMEGRPRRLSIYDNAKNLHPTWLKSLRNLQTLDIRNTNLTSLPTGINRLQQLRHLHIASFCDREKGFLKMPKGKKWFKNLQTLSGVEPDEDLLKELRSLTNLRKLYIGGMNKTNSEELWVSLGEMKSLRSFTMVADSSPERPQVESLSRPPPSLEKLKLQVSMTRLPKWFVSLRYLHTLYLLKNFLMEDPFPILQQLPNLFVLILASSAFLSTEICCRPGGFPKLTLLRILGMENWRRWMPIEEGTMPNLRYLLIADCPRLLGLPEGFHHLTALQDLTLIRMSSYLSCKLQGTDHWKVHHIPEVSIISQDGAEFLSKSSDN